MKKKLWLLSFIMAMVFMMAGVNIASASVITLRDEGSTVRINPTGASGNPDGMFDWEINGGDSLYQQWFWFRIGTETDGNAGHSISELTLVTTLLTNSKSDPNNYEETVEFIYSGTVDGATVKITAWFSLDGVPSLGNKADLAEQVSIQNLGDTSITFSLYEYNDFDLAGVAGDTAYINADRTKISQYDGTTHLAEVIQNATAGVADYPKAEVSLVPDDLIDRIILGENLNNSATETELFAVLPDDPDNLTWAFQWTWNIPADGIVLVSKDKMLVTPVPTTLLLFGSGLLSLIGVGIRRRKS